MMLYQLQPINGWFVPYRGSAGSASKRHFARAFGGDVGKAPDDAGENSAPWKPTSESAEIGCHPLPQLTALLCQGLWRNRRCQWFETMFHIIMLLVRYTAESGSLFGYN